MKALHLATVEKSGTNYARIALMNYLSALSGDHERKTYDDVEAAFPNRQKVDEHKPCRADLLPPGVEDFLYGHNVGWPMKATQDGPVVYLVRNPLDQAVSWFHYAKTRRPKATEEIGILNLSLERLPGFAQKWSSMSAYAERDERATIFHYEDLMEEPERVFSEMFEHWGLPIEPELVSQSIRHSSKKAAQAFEDEKGFMHANPDKRSRWKGKRFVRDGSIGQWRTAFMDEEVKALLTRMEELEIPESDFRYLPRDPHAAGA